MATVRQDEQGNLVLDDPMAVAVITAVEKHNCSRTLELNADRVRHFARRAKELARSPADVVIVIANVDTPAGRVLADALMPGYDWQQFRDAGEVPFARGLAGRQGIQEFIQEVDADAGAKLLAHEDLAVVVVDYGTVDVFSASEVPSP